MHKQMYGFYKHISMLNRNCFIFPKENGLFVKLQHYSTKQRVLQKNSTLLQHYCLVVPSLFHYIIAEQLIIKGTLYFILSSGKDKTERRLITGRLKGPFSFLNYLTSEP